MRPQLSLAVVICLATPVTSYAQPTGGASQGKPSTILQRLFGTYACGGFSRMCLWDGLQYGVAHVPPGRPPGLLRSDTSIDSRREIDESSEITHPSWQAIIFKNAVDFGRELAPLADRLFPGLPLEEDSFDRAGSLRSERFYQALKANLYAEESNYRFIRENAEDDGKYEEFAFIYAKRPNGQRLQTVLSTFVVWDVDVEFLMSLYQKLYPEAKRDGSRPTLLFDAPLEMGWIILEPKKLRMQDVVVIFKGAGWLGDVRAHRDEMRLAFRSRWEQSELSRLRLPNFSALADYFVMMARKHLGTDPSLVRKDVAPFLLFASDLSDSQLEEMTQLSAQASLKIESAKAKAAAEEKAAEEKRLAEQRVIAEKIKRDSARQEAEWRERQQREEEERRRLSDPKLVTRVTLCRAYGDLDDLYGARAYQSQVEAESRVADLPAKRLIGERIVQVKAQIAATLPRFQNANGRPFARVTDCSASR